MNITFICPPGASTFLPDIIKGLGEIHDTRLVATADVHERDDAIAWADLVWLEWADELAVELTCTRPTLRETRVVCRLHSYEAFSGAVGRMNWSVVDDLIVVAPHIRDIVHTQLVAHVTKPPRLHVIPNGVDVNRFTFRSRSPGHELAVLGSINHKKGPMLLLHALRALVDVDPAYRVSIAGDVQDVRYVLYFEQMRDAMGLRDNLRLDGHVDDVDGWLASKQYIVCTSLLEGHPVGLMEGMAAGLKPVIHRYVGATGVFPEEVLWTTIPEFVSMIQTPAMHSAAYRALIEQRYSVRNQIARLHDVIGISVPAVS